MHTYGSTSKTLPKYLARSSAPPGHAAAGDGGAVDAAVQDLRAICAKVSPRSPIPVPWSAAQILQRMHKGRRIAARFVASMYETGSVWIAQWVQAWSNPPFFPK